MSVTRVLTFVFGWLIFVQSLTAQESISVLYWNVESGGTDANTIAGQLSQLVADEEPFDLVGLTEVRPEDSDDYVAALGANYTGIVSNTGDSDRMVIAFNEDRFNLVQLMELNEHDGIALNFFNSGGRPRFRSPLVAELQEESGTRRFFFMVNHLAFKWIRPEPLVDTNHSGDTRTDSFPNSILDFVTVANAPAGWKTIESEVIVRPGDLPDDGSTSDHRPVHAVFESGAAAVNVAALLQRIRVIRRELEAMEALLEGREARTLTVRRRKRTCQQAGARRRTSSGASTYQGPAVRHRLCRGTMSLYRARIPRTTHSWQWPSIGRAVSCAGSTRSAKESAKIPAALSPRRLPRPMAKS